MIPTLLDEFQTESQKAIEDVFGDLGHEVTSLDAGLLGVLVTAVARASRPYRLLAAPRPAD